MALVQAFFVLLYELRRGRDDVVCLKILECGFHLVLDIAKFSVDGNCALALWADISVQDRFILVILKVINLASSREIDSLRVKSHTKSNLMLTFVLSVGEKFV